MSEVIAMATSRKAYAHYYRTRAWQERRAHQLRLEPMCARCGALAAVVHHIAPHKGDWILFIEGELRSLCKRCHDGAEQMIEKRGFLNEIGVDGWPTDPRAPANRRG
jgi:5-methylcytosine-specific restriction enzyme A